MNVLRFAFLGCLFAGLVGCGTPTSTPVRSGGGTTNGTPAAAVEKSKKEMIVGTWQPVVKEGPVPTIEFAKDGKLKVSMKVGDQTQTMEGTWEVKGDELTKVLKVPPAGKEEKSTDTITKLTATEMTTKDAKGRVEEYKKK